MRDTQQQILAELRRANRELARLSKLVDGLSCPPDLSGDMGHAVHLLEQILENTGGPARPRKILRRRPPMERQD